MKPDSFFWCYIRIRPKWPKATLLNGLKIQASMRNQQQQLIRANFKAVTVSYHAKGHLSRN